MTARDAELDAIREHSRQSLISCAETLETLATRATALRCTDVGNNLRKHAVQARKSAKLFNPGKPLPWERF